MSKTTYSNIFRTKNNTCERRNRGKFVNIRVIGGIDPILLTSEINVQETK